MVKRTFCIILILLLSPLSLLAAQVSAVADRDRIGAGESLQLELRVQGSAEDDPDLRPLDENWDILNRSQSKQMQIINGKISHSLVISLALMPRHTGELEIPSICFGSDCTIPLPIQVSDATATPETEAGKLLLEAEVTPRQALAGSQLLLTVRVLHRVDLAQASLSDPQPQGVDAEIQKLGEDHTYETRRNGYRYQAVERRYALFAHQAGTLQIPALQLDAKVATTRSSFDPFSRSIQSLRRSTQPIDIEISPIPGDLGSREWLPTSNLTLEDDWQTHPPQLRVGEPATRTLTLSAAGLLSAHLPELNIAVPTDWKSYPDQPNRSDAVDTDGVIGTLQQKIALVPTQPGEVELPAIDLDWYDTRAQQWRRAHIEPLRVSVAPAAAGTAPVNLAPQTASSPVAPDPLKSHNLPASQQPHLETTQTTSSAQFWPWLSLILALGWLLSLIFFWWQRRQLQPRKMSKKQNNQLKITQEKDAYNAILTAANQNNPKAARDALSAWSRLHWPGSEPWDLDLMAKNCGDPLASELRKLGQALYAKNAPSWRGEGLTEALRHSLQSRTNPSQQEDLPSLYPATKGSTPK
ncbi:Oxygen tolerance [Desulfuromusa kysingii]|uniref:Oxygen tolerance n=1 Tax=Desulfuromusa kysingii TaxID=37625 RepID=A0A1H3ZIU1_9BACT|nr:BatD family protein [Desulfuromusa kysingii]SEA23321.1 Oxygen tolerance [Desulfuromusa kysingii]